jgi:hypothetical protein
MSDRLSGIRSETWISLDFLGFCLWIDFDDLHFTDSFNASPLIVRSS